MPKFAKLFALLAFFAIASHSAVNYPYPQAKSYGNSTINVTSANASSDLKTRFNSFLTNFYTTGTCPGNVSCARIKFDNTAETVSEGIGYGMIMMVYFSDKTTSYQDHFDKLWAYYNSWLNSNGLMHWHINGFSNVMENNAATDAEFDVALALAMAYYQFGDEKYKTAANNLIAKIRLYEMETSGANNGLHKPGDAWNSERNPSYVSPAAFEIFKTFDASNSSFWGTAITKNYELLINNQKKSSVYLPSDWCTNDGSVSRTHQFGYDAARAPWRWAWANAWYGHSEAKTLLGNLAPWVNNQNVTNVGGVIKADGTLGNDKNSTFLGPLTNVLSYSSTYQAKMNTYWSSLIGKTSEPYFSAAMQLLTGLLATGNMPNLKALADGGTPPQPSSSSAGGSSSSRASSSSTANLGYTRIDNFQDEDGLANTLEPWYIYTDKNDNGASTVSNAKDEKGDYITVDKESSNSTNWVAYIKSYSLSQGANKNEPYVAIGLDAKNNQKNTAQGGYDLSKCSNGFSYRYKGAAHNFKVQQSDVTDYAYHYAQILTASNSNWTTVEFKPTELLQPSWTTSPKNQDLKKINSFAWEIKGGLSGAAGLSGLTGSLMIDDFTCIGNMTLPSKPSSSSSSSKTNVSSSSGYVYNPSSSSNYYQSPIMLSPVAAKNATQLISNGISLQTQNGAALEIFNMNGTLLRRMDFSSGVYTVDFKDLPKGLYIAKIRFGNSSKEILKVPVR